MSCRNIVRDGFDVLPEGELLNHGFGGLSTRAMFRVQFYRKAALGGGNYREYVPLVNYQCSKRVIARKTAPLTVRTLLLKLSQLKKQHLLYPSIVPVAKSSAN